MAEQNISEKILIKSLELFKQYGLRSVSMDDIASELAISKKTIYEHVKDKAELIEMVLLKKLNFNIKEFEEVFNNFNKNAIEKILILNDKIVGLIKEFSPAIKFDLQKYYPELYTKIIDTKKKKMIKMIAENIKNGKKENLFREDIDENTITKLHISGIDAICDNSFFNNKHDSVNLFSQLLDYHIRGIVNDKGLELFEKLKK